MSQSAEWIQQARRYHLSDIPQRSAQRYGERLALVDGETQLNFQEFYQYTERLAVHFSALGLVAGDRLLLLSHNCWQVPVISFAAARLGIITVPVNFMLNPTELSYIVAHSRSKIACVEDQLVSKFQQACDITPHAIAHFYQIDLNQFELQPRWHMLPDLSQATTFTLASDNTLTADQPIRMMYTSGTESQPKGVLLNSEALMWQYMSSMLEGEMQRDDREIHAFPLYHCAQLDAFLNVDLYLGTTSYILRGFDPAKVLHTIAREKITKLFCPPTAWIALMNHADFSTTDLNSLSKAYYGASAMPKSVIETLLQKLPHIRFWQFYGQTEMAPIATVLYPEDHQHHASSVGRPVMHVNTQIMDQSGKLLQVGEIGEIVHRSVHLTLGYADDVEKTTEAFREGWFHSGDLGYFDADGYLYIVDRMKDMVKTGGENVATREVEEAIYQLPEIQEVAVFALSDPHWIEAVSACVVLRDHSSGSTEHIIKHCKQNLAAYKVPKHIFIVTELPKNASGKILKRQLRIVYQQQLDQALTA